MLVAVALDEAGTVSHHLGRSDVFAVYEILDGAPTLVERRDNPHKAGCSGHHHDPEPKHECGGDHQHHDGHAGCGHDHPAPAAGSTRGAWISGVMTGCNAVIAGFIPPPARHVLRSIGVQPVLAPVGADPLACLAEFVGGRS